MPTAKPVILMRAYDKTPTSGYYRVLVDRLWPRGIKKQDLSFDEWCKDLAPSVELRRWFGHRTDRWPEFRRAYAIELYHKKDLIRGLDQRSGERPLCLVYAARDPACNHALVLKAAIESIRRHR